MSNGQRIACIILSIVTLLESVIFAFVYPGFLRKAIMKKDAVVHEVEILFPKPTEEEVLVDLTADLSVHYYIVARMYLEKFLQYDIEEGSVEEYEALLADTIVAFENVEKISGGLSDAVDIWMDADDPEEGPKYRILTVEPEAGDFVADPFVIPVYAAEESQAYKDAKKLVEAYDKAPAGKGLRTLAEQMGKDAKYAYAQLKQAQALLEGKEYMEIADAANEAYKTASVLKTAGTAAGLVIAVAPIAAGGTAAATVGGVLEGVCTAGGAVMSGINTVLEVGSTTSILIYNGEDNAFSKLCDSVESKMAPIGALFGLGGAASNVKNLVQNGNKLIKDGKSILQSTELTDDAYGLISYTVGALNDYTQNGVLLGGTFTKTNDGLKLTLEDTMIGTKPEQQEAMAKVLKDAGVPSKEVQEVLKASAKNIAKGMSADDFPPSLPEEGEAEEPVPPEVVEEILKENEGILPGEDDFDLDGFVEAVHDIKSEAAAAQLSDDEDAAEDSEAEELPGVSAEDTAEADTKEESDSGDSGYWWDDTITEGAELVTEDSSGSVSKDSSGSAPKESSGAAFETTVEGFGNSMNVWIEPVADMEETESGVMGKSPQDSYKQIYGTRKQGDSLRFKVSGTKDEYVYSIHYMDSAQHHIDQIMGNGRSGEEIAVNNIPAETVVTWIDIVMSVEASKRLRCHLFLITKD